MLLPHGIPDEDDAKHHHPRFPLPFGLEVDCAPAELVAQVAKVLVLECRSLAVGPRLEHDRVDGALDALDEVVVQA